MLDNINWYPGHMKKTRDMIRENLKLVNAVIEVADARIPAASRNTVVRELTGNKYRIIVLNKSDLADPAATAAWVKALEDGGEHVVQTDCRTGSGMKRLTAALSAAEKEIFGGADHHKPFRLMIVGVPNAGKSSLINRLTGRRTTQVGDRPGVTRGKQWLTLKNGMQLMDTPGILRPKFENRETGLYLAFCGSIKDEIIDSTELGLELIRVLSEKYPAQLAERYKLESLGDTPLKTMEAAARKRGFLLSGGRIDYERTALTVLDEFRSGRIGRITLELPGD